MESVCNGCLKSKARTSRRFVSMLKSPHPVPTIGLPEILDPVHNRGDSESDMARSKTWYAVSISERS